MITYANMIYKLSVILRFFLVSSGGGGGGCVELTVYTRVTCDLAYHATPPIFMHEK